MAAGGSNRVVYKPAKKRESKKKKKEDNSRLNKAKHVFKELGHAAHLLGRVR